MNEPDLAQVQESIVELLRDQEVAALATLSGNGYPSASDMHIASDGTVVYLHTFANTRKFTEMQKDSRVSYVVSHVPSGGFAERALLRSLQVKGRATMVTDADEVRRAVELSMQQFAWMRETHIYDNVTTPAEDLRRAFFRVDPVEAVWSDHRVRQLWRVNLFFSQDGHRLESMTPYR